MLAGGGNGRRRCNDSRCPRAIDRSLQCVAIGCIDNRIVRGRHDRAQEAQELRGLDRGGVRRINDVLIPHLEGLREEIAGGITEIDNVNDRNDGALEARTVNSEPQGNLPVSPAPQNFQDFSY